jgi:hypothetical protein
MRRITMRDFHWLGKPRTYKKDHQMVSLEVDGHTCLPSGPLLLAVSDEYFCCDATLSIPKKDNFGGICIYHLDSCYAAVGLSSDALEVHTCISGFANRSCFGSSSEAEEAIWTIKRDAQGVAVGYRFAQDDEVRWVSNIHLPGCELSLSFGPYFTNAGDTKYTASMYALRYAKQEV